MATENTEIDDLRWLLEAGAEDTAICEAFERLLVSLNAAGIASKYFAAAGVVCVRRPHLAARLLVRPVECCLLIGAVSVADVIRSGVAVSHDPFYASLAGSDGVQWLQEELPRLTSLVEQIVEERRTAFAVECQEFIEEQGRPA